MKKSTATLDRLRSLCMGLPETNETQAFGHPNFRAGKKTFCVFEHYHGRPCIAFKATVPEQQTLVGDERFFVTPYVGKHGWVSLWVDRPFSWSMVKDLALRADRLAASNKMHSVLDSGAGPSPRRPSLRRVT